MGTPTRFSPPFKRLVWSNLLAQAAEQIGLATAPLLAVFLFSASTSQTAALQMVQTLPFLLLAIPAGLLADRSSRKTVLAFAEGLRAFSFGLILLLIALESLTLSTLALLGFVGAMGTVAYNVTTPGLVPHLVARPLLSMANSRLELARSIAFTSGPGVAGLVFSSMGASFSYCLALVFSLSAVNFLRSLPPNPIVPRHGRLWAQLSEGMYFTLASPLLRPVLITAVIFNMSWFMLQAAFVPYAAEHLELSALEVGITMACYGLGMIAGAVAAPWAGRQFSFGSMIISGPIGALLGAAAIAYSIWYPSLALACASFFLFGAGPILWTISTTTLRQAVTPPDLISRVSAVIMTMTYGTRPIGALMAAMIGSIYPAEYCILAAAIGFIAQLAVIVCSNVPKLAGIPGPEPRALPG
ncbi:MFS transporter [Pollutimonas sp. H1-120]|uniref:MFS transporter n=1 Tax=Pollutimonas sp. H1-120 TaxID=3148824 RepID=UPI003B53025A